MSSLKWVKELHSIMEEVGFEDVRREEIRCNLRLAKYYQDMQFLVMEEEATKRPTAKEKDFVSCKECGTVATGKRGSHLRSCA